MDLSDEITIPAPRDQVYAALNDAEVLKAAIPGCEALERRSDTEFHATIRLAVGPMKARFTGRVTLDPRDAPERFSLHGEGTGGAAGFARGGAAVELEDRGDETLLRYEAKAEVGGKLAQLGNRLVAGAARKLAAQFFESFSRQVSGGH